MYIENPSMTREDDENVCDFVCVFSVLQPWNPLPPTLFSSLIKATKNRAKRTHNYAVIQNLSILFEKLEIKIPTAVVLHSTHTIIKITHTYWYTCVYIYHM